MRVGLLLLGMFPERQLYAAGSIANAIGSDPGAQDWDLVALTTDSRLDGVSVPGRDAVKVLQVASVITDDPGDCSAEHGYRVDDFLRLTSAEAASCDLWILLDEATGFPLCMDRPTLLWMPEVTDRYVSNAIPDTSGGWAFGRRAAFVNRVAATTVIVHDRMTASDALDFAQIPAARTRTLPAPGQTLTPHDPNDAPRSSPYIYWHLSIESPDRLHQLAAALDTYMGTRFGQCGLVIGGPLIEGGQPGLAKPPTPNEKAFVGKVRAMLGTRSWSERMVDSVPAGDVHTTLTWARRATAILLGRGWRTNQPILDHAAHSDQPVMLLGGGRPARDLSLRLARSHVLTDDDRAAAIFLKSAETGTIAIDSTADDREVDHATGWREVIEHAAQVAIA